MRNIVIGIVIGVVVGVMIGATVVAPRLEQARQNTPLPEVEPNVPGAENLNLSEDQNKTPVPKPISRLRLITMFPAKMPILGELAQRLKRAIPTASGGRLGVNVFDSGALVDADDTLAAVASGTADALFSVPGQWDPDDPTLQLFTAVPFGPDAQEHLAWFYNGGGRELFENMMKQKGVHAILCGALPPEASGWYREPLRNPESFKHKNIRAFGLGGDVLAKMGANVVRLDASDILAQFEQGQLDGAEYSLPSIDAELGFQKFARNYYFPGWHQPVTLLTLAINSEVWKNFPARDRDAITAVCGDNVRYAMAQADAEQFEALKKLGLAGVQIRRWPDDILQALESAWKDVVREHTQQDKNFANAWNSLQKFRRDYGIWHEISRF